MISSSITIWHIYSLFSVNTSSSLKANLSPNNIAASPGDFSLTFLLRLKSILTVYRSPFLVNSNSNYRCVVALVVVGLYLQNTLRHSALKLEKSAISKVQKHIFCYFKNGKKINFCTRKKFKTTKNENFGLFSGAKIDFLPCLKMQIMCFCTFEIALFFQF